MAIAVIRLAAVAETAPSPLVAAPPRVVARANPTAAQATVTAAGVVGQGRFRQNPKLQASPAVRGPGKQRGQTGRVDPALRDVAPDVDVAEEDEIAAGKVREPAQAVVSRRMWYSPLLRTACMTQRVQLRSNRPDPSRPRTPAAYRMLGRRPNRMGVATGRRQTPLPLGSPARYRNPPPNLRPRTRRLSHRPRVSLNRTSHRTRIRTRFQPGPMSRRPRQRWIHTRVAPQ